MPDLIGHLLPSPPEAAGLRLSKQKNACPAAPCRFIRLRRLAAAASTARPTHTPRRRRQTATGPHTSSPPAAAKQRPARIPVIPGLTGNLLPRGKYHLFRPGIPAKTCQVPRNSRGPARNNSYFMPGLQVQRRRAATAGERVRKEAKSVTESGICDSVTENAPYL